MFVVPDEYNHLLSGWSAKGSDTGKLVKLVELRESLREQIERQVENSLEATRDPQD